MDNLIKSARIIDPGGPHHNHVKDIHISAGKVVAIEDSLVNQGASVIAGEELVVFPGFIDIHAECGEPGEEWREDYASLSSAALKGGFTRVGVSPQGKPCTNMRAQIEHVINRSQKNKNVLLPIGALTTDVKGEVLNELFDLSEAGAVAFSNGYAPIINPDVMRRALLYNRDFKQPLMVASHDAEIQGEGVMNEGPMSTSLGVKGIPNLAEDLSISRDLQLLDYTNSSMHLLSVSTANAVELIREAKNKGLKVSCSVSLHNLVYNDEELASFDTNFKVFPPLRSKHDQQALIAGLNDGTIDIITANHTPYHVERKDCEFEHAAFGMSLIEVAIPLLVDRLGDSLDPEILVNALATNPAKLLGLPEQHINAGNRANLTVIDYKGETAIESQNWESKSRNFPEFGTTLNASVHCFC